MLLIMIRASCKIIMSCPVKGDINNIASKYLNDQVKSVEDAITGAKYIIAEWTSDNAYYRKWIRSYIFKEGVIVSKLKRMLLMKRRLIVTIMTLPKQLNILNLIEYWR